MSRRCSSGKPLSAHASALKTLAVHRYPERLAPSPPGALSPAPERPIGAALELRRDPTALKDVPQREGGHAVQQLF